jgi:hypothetical protein
VRQSTSSATDVAQGRADYFLALAQPGQAALALAIAILGYELLHRKHDGVPKRSEIQAAVAGGKRLGFTVDHIEHSSHAAGAMLAIIRNRSMMSRGWR